MKFWKKYKAKKKLEKAKKELREKLEKEKKELREKLEKARFVNFYGREIDLSLGRIKEIERYTKGVEEMNGIFPQEVFYYYIILKYDNFKERYLSYGQAKSIRDVRIYELNSFIKSDKFTQYLNNYENLKKEYEQL